MMANPLRIREEKPFLGSEIDQDLPVLGGTDSFLSEAS